MLQLNRRVSKLTVMLIVMAVCCFMFAGVALAQPQMTVQANGNDFGIAEQGNIPYILNINNLDIDASCFTLNDQNEITVTFDGGFDLSATAGQTVPVSAYVYGDWYYAQPTPVISGNTATFTLPAFEELGTPQDVSGLVAEKIQIGDTNQPLIVKNPCADESFCIDVAFSGCSSFDVTKVFPIYDMPVDVNLTYDQIGYACDDTCTTGALVNCAGEILDNCEVHLELRPVGGSWTNVSDVHELNADRQFDICFDNPEAAGDYEVRVVARHYNKKDNGDKFYTTGYLKSGAFPLTIVGNEAAKVDLVFPRVAAETEDGLVKFNKCNELTVELLDSCNENLATNSMERTIKLDAYYYQNGVEAPVVAGHFFANAADCAADQNQIGKVTIPANQNTVDVFFKPIVRGLDGTVTLKASSVGLEGDQNDVQIAYVDKAELEVRPLVWETDTDNPRAGWPLACAAWLDSNLYPEMGAAGDYEVLVSAVDAKTDEELDFSVSRDLNPAYGDCGDGKTFNAEYCTVKNHFYIYTNESWADRDVEIKVSFVNENGDLIESDVMTIGDFVTGIELKRELAVDTWQLISTPRYLAKECVAADGNPANYGTFEELLANVNYSKIMTWDENGWRTVAGSEVVEPLKAYFVKTSQGSSPMNPSEYEIDYVFARVTNPAAMMPKNRALNAGWNIVGISVDDTANRYTDQKYQSDDIYVAMGAVYKGAKLVWNPGEYVGNLANFISASWIGSNASDDTDDNGDVYNGDGYWVYLTDWQTLTGNVGQDLINDAK
ncbi:MAG: hypothetical protein FH758_06300 [Firmicutes bacterium]|nr:hypothetical protein [Bacillota bacterium]